MPVDANDLVPQNDSTNYTEYNRYAYKGFSSSLLPGKRQIIFLPVSTNWNPPSISLSHAADMVVEISISPTVSIINDYNAGSDSAAKWTVLANSGNAALLAVPFVCHALRFKNNHGSATATVEVLC